jgi:hypothetical protein
MPKNLNFAALVPERHTFTDTDGAVYEMLSRADFSVTAMAKATRLQKQFPTWADRLSKSPDDVKAAEQLENAITEMVRIIIPDLPQARLDAFTLGQKQMILDFWNQRMAEAGAGEVKAGQASSHA